MTARLVLDGSGFLKLAGRAGGQLAYGGTGAGEELTLRGTSNANLGLIRAQSPIVFDDTGAANALSAYDVASTFTSPKPAAFIGGFLLDNRKHTFSNSTFIYETLGAKPVLTSGANPSFAAFTCFNSLPQTVSGTVATHNPLQQIHLNCGGSITHLNTGTRTSNFNAVGCSTTVNVAGGSGSTLNIGNYTGFQFSPKWNTTSGNTANFGNMRGLWCQDPAATLFGSSTGVETSSYYVGVYMENITIPVAFTRIGMYSVLTPAAANYFLYNAGGAQSRFGNGQLTECGQIIQPLDLNGRTIGASGDFQDGWSGANFYFWQFNGTTNQMRWSNPSSHRYLLQGSGGNTLTEVNIDCARFSFGAQSGLVGNQVGVFVAGARATQAPGGWSDFLLTQASGLQVDHAMSQVYAWTVNASTMVLGGSGSVTDAGGLLIGGNVNEGTNRYGIHVLSSPTGGTLNYCARFEGAAGVRVDGSLFMLGGSGTFIQSPVMTTTQRNTMVTSWGSAEAGREWFNSTTGQGEAWNGTTTVVRY